MKNLFIFNDISIFLLFDIYTYIVGTIPLSENEHDYVYNYEIIYFLKRRDTIH